MRESKFAAAKVHRVSPFCGQMIELVCAIYEGEANMNLSLLKERI